MHLVEKLASDFLVAARQVLISSPPLDDSSLLGPCGLTSRLLQTAVLFIGVICDICKIAVEVRSSRVEALGQGASNDARLA